MKKKSAAVACMMLCLYAATYVVMSLRGRYEPAAWGLNGVKAYAWAPDRFIDGDLRWNRALTGCFLPLYFLDTRFWHSQKAFDSRKYPIDWIESHSRDNGEPTTPAQDPTFEFTVSGDLAGKLEPDTRVLIWSPVTETNGAHFSIKDMPVAVPYKQLAAGHNWYASFVSPKQHAIVFSIGLDPALFDRPRRIDLRLDRPTPRIRPSFAGKLQFHYYAGITQRMWYEKMPAWDHEKQRIIAAEPPTMSVIRVSDGRKLLESAMTTGCMGSKWWLDAPRGLGDKTDLHLAVRYDSGGLWEPIETKLNFTYHKE